jgi:hypothetical protein
MKKLMFLVSLVIASLTINAQQADWKEMHAFHAVMSKTFHPAEEGNLKPTKDSATVLVAKAKAWQSSTVPQGYNAKVTAPILKQLVAKLTTVKEAVAAKKTDDELKKLMTEAHEIFHEITEKCKTEEKH